MSQVVVLGMHRSGTSMVAGILAKLGVFMGKSLLGPTPGNPAGHWEDREFLAINEEILRRAGGSWDSPPSHEATMAVDVSGDIERLIHKRANLSIWGWKDPRTVLTIEHYTPYLIGPLYIAVFREREAVVKSLMCRNYMIARVANALYDTYDDRLAAFLDNRQQLQVQYEDVIADPECGVRWIADYVGLPVTGEAIEHVRPELNHA